MDVIQLSASTDRELGSGPARRLRATGKIPGVVYGLGQSATPVAVDYRELRNALTGEAGLNALLSLEIDGTKQLSIVKDLQRDPIRQTVTHIDFLRVDENVAVDVDVPIVLVGEGEAVTKANGIISQSLHSIVVAARPDDIPSQLEINIDALELGQVITVAELELPEGVTTSHDLDAAIVHGEATRAAVEEAAAEDGEGEDGEGDGAGADEGDGE